MYFTRVRAADFGGTPEDKRRPRTFGNVNDNNIAAPLSLAADPDLQMGLIDTRGTQGVQQ